MFDKNDGRIACVFGEIFVDRSYFPETNVFFVLFYFISLLANCFSNTPTNYIVATVHNLFIYWKSYE